MAVYTDRKFLLLISARLRNFKQKNDDLFNFSCCFCGDSKKNQLKARGYIFRALDHDGYLYKCYNCNISTNFANFLKHLDTKKYQEYIMETFKKEPRESKQQQIIEQTEPKKLLKLKDIKIPSMNDLEPDHYALDYIKARKIPEQYYNEIFYTDDYLAFLDETFPGHGKPLIKGDRRIVLFYTNQWGEINNVSGRSFGADPKLRYITVKVSEERKVFGLHRLNLNKPVYITEGQFDSFFLENAIASGDSNLVGLADWMYDTYGIKAILVFDREPRNKDIVKQISKAIKKNYSVVLLPESFLGKDLNEAVAIYTASIDYIRNIVDEYTYQGLEAELALTGWRKC